MSLFNTITIRTPESVELKLTLAGIGSRIAALAIDYTVLGGLLLLVTLLWSGLSIALQSTPVWLGIDSATWQQWVTALGFVLAFGLWIGYFSVSETWWSGQSVGKRYAKIRVVRTNGQPVRLPQATLRALLRPVDDVLFIGFLCILLTPSEQRLGDRMAGTLVVQAEPPRTGEGLKREISDRAQVIGHDLQSLMNLDAISPDTFATVRDYLLRRSAMVPAGRAKVSAHLAQHCRQLAHLEDLPTDMTADTFLEALYWAYQQRYAGLSDRAD